MSNQRVTSEWAAASVAAVLVRARGAVAAELAERLQALMAWEPKEKAPAGANQPGQNPGAATL